MSTTRKDFEAILEEYFSECINFSETPTHWVGKVWYLGMEFVVGYEKPGQPQGLFPHPWFAAIETLGVNYGPTFEAALSSAAKSAIGRFQNNIKSLKELCAEQGQETSDSSSQ